jgi:hypothetical protein
VDGLGRTAVGGLTEGEDEVAMDREDRELPGLAELLRDGDGVAVMNFGLGMLRTPEVKDLRWMDLDLVMSRAKLGP